MSPACVTREQMRAVCELLGLPDETLRLTLDTSDGLEASVWRRSDDTGLLLIDAAGEVVKRIIHAPIESASTIAPGDAVASGVALIGEGPVCCLPQHDGQQVVDVTLEFDSSPETLARLRDAIRRAPFPSR